MYVVIENVLPTQRGNLWILASYWTAKGGTLLHREQHRLFLGDDVPGNLSALIKQTVSNTIGRVATDYFRKTKLLAPEAVNPQAQFKIDPDDKTKLLPGLSSLIGQGWEAE